MAVERRTVLAGLGAGALAAGAGALIAGAGSALAQNGLRTRREVSDLEENFPAELDRYRRAVAEMRKSTAAVTAWERNARSHAARCGGTASREIHYTWFFLPWHRAFLWVTEQNLQHVIGDSNLALPYWHWPVLGRVPPSFLNGDLQHSRDQTMLDPVDYDFTAGMAAPAYVGTFKQENGQFEITKIGFGGYTPTPFALSALEGTPHGSVHNIVGGAQDMGNISWSPRDPIFFAHHGNLDRLWEAWRGPLASAARNSEPWSNPAFANKSYDFFDLRTGMMRTVRVAEIKETADLGYRYALPGEGPAGAPPIGVAGGAPAAPVVPDPTRLGAPVARGEATISAPGVGVGQGGPAPRARAVLTLQGIEVPPQRSANLAVYLVDRTRPAFDPRSAVFAGTFAVVRQAEPTSVNLALDVTDSLRRTRIDQGKVGVVVVPIGKGDQSPVRVSGYRINVTPEKP